MEADFEKLNTREEVLAIARQNGTFREVKSGFNGGVAFEVDLSNKVIFYADFISDYEVAYYEFLDSKRNSIYNSGSMSFYVENLDWTTLLNDTRRWVSRKEDQLDDALKSARRKEEAARKKYDRTDKYSDAEAWRRCQRVAASYENRVKKINDLMKML